MGREVRRVPPNWQHPTGDNGEYLSLLEDYEEHRDEWLAGFEAHSSSENGGKDYWHWEFGGMPPDPDDYVHYGGVEPTWFQVYETLSEGSPVSPPFETEEELINHLAEHGDDTDLKGWGKEAATKFVKNRWAPSFVLS